MNRTSTNNDIVKYIYNELEERETLKLNFKGLTEPSIYNEISSFLVIKSHLIVIVWQPKYHRFYALKGIHIFCKKRIVF